MVKPESVEELKALVGEENVLTSPEELLCYSYDSTVLQHLPEIVVLPYTTQEVAATVKLADREKIPIVPRGAGTNLAGGTIPIQGGIVLSLTRMTQILEIDTINMVAVVQPGVVTGKLQAEVARKGLYYPPDPASLKVTTLGGNVAMNAGGPHALKYGVTSDYVMGLEVVLPNGQVIRTGGKAIKNVTGYNLTQLFVGSEGTLGVVTEIILRLIPQPQSSGSVLAAFSDLDDAATLVNRILKAGVTPAVIEIMDNMTIQTVDDYLGTGLPRDAAALLLIQVDGVRQAVEQELKTVAQLCNDNKATQVEVARTEDEEETVWEARRSISPSLTRVRPNKLGEDISVPREAIPDVVRRIEEISRQRDLPIVIFGHISDGNLHPNILFDQTDPEEIERVEAAAGDIFEAATAVGGTLSGEHGIGLLKQKYLRLDLPTETIEVMRTVKRALDPNNIMNPGKIFPDN
ncbi:MAG: glycolate oxidase subunit GlcD [Chloroflexi bacterium B3_Chlor]|nr:MAG: glycolate oxidase subunit GlcD [Chloroflexi bacterium B3_Chlor]